MRHRLLLFGMLAVLLLAACKLESGAEGGPIPTIGPVQAGSGGSGAVTLELTSSTNCAEVGEIVTFTVRIINETTFPATITGTPSLDMTIQPAYWLKAGPPPVQRWSASSQYPEHIDRVLAVGEEQNYQWHWTADAIYVQQDLNKNNILVTASAATLVPRQVYPQGNGVDIFVGVSSMNWGLGGIRCTDMRR